MRIKSACIFSVLLTGFFTALSAHAKEIQQEKELTVTIEQAVEYAVKGNIGLMKNTVSLNEAKRTKNFSWNAFSPSLSAGASWSKEVPASEKSALSKSSDAGTITVQANANLALTPSLYTNIKSASLAYERQLITYEQAVRSVELNVRTSFWALLNQQENISLQEKKLEAGKKQYESNLAKFNRGALSKLDVLTAQVSYQEAQVNLEAAKTSRETAMATFKQILGLPQETKITLLGSLEEILSLKEISRENLSINSPDIILLKKRIEQAKNSLTATRLTCYGPSLSASYSYSMSSPADDTGSLKDNGGGTLRIGATLPLDGLLPWSNGSQNIENQKDNLKTLELELEEQKTSLDVTINNYLSQIKQIQDLIALRKSSIELAEQSYTMALDAYNHGTKDLLSLQNAQDSLFSTRVNLLTQAYTLETTVLNLENIIGVPFGTLGK